MKYTAQHDESLNLNWWKPGITSGIVPPVAALINPFQAPAKLQEGPLPAINWSYNPL